jgi:hypothetical protein
MEIGLPNSFAIYGLVGKLKQDNTLPSVVRPKIISSYHSGCSYAETVSDHPQSGHSSSFIIRPMGGKHSGPHLSAVKKGGAVRTTIRSFRGAVEDRPERRKGCFGWDELRGRYCYRQVGVSSVAFWAHVGEFATGVATALVYMLTVPAEHRRVGRALELYASKVHTGAYEDNAYP